ncbi:pentapeptide repeat-containing protein [bacterium]|nr:pentapeptide repeat-containing protein [bacterium]
MNNLTIYNQCNESFCPDEIYTYLQITRKNLSGMDMHSISFKNCIIEETDFSKTLFANSDFDSSHIENCSFDNQSFQNSDIISCDFKKCKFVRVNFKGSTMMSNTFENCIFISCNFNHVTMSDSTFKSCVIDNMNLRQSSTSLNTFIECNWFNSQINGNFVFNLIINSSFEKTSIDPLVMSSNFGIDPKNLIELGINYDELEKLQQNLIDNKELINAAIVELNSNNYSYEYSLVFCINVILQQIQNNIIVRSEEIRFIELVLAHSLEHDLITPITIIQLLSLIDTFKKSGIKNIAAIKSKSDINFIHNTLFKAYQNYIDELDSTISEININNADIIIKFTFKEKPTIETCALLQSLQKQLGFCTSEPIQIKTEKGSFIEWIESPDNILKCLQILLSIIGILIKVKPKPSKDVQKEEPNHNVNNVSQQGVGNTIVLNLPDTISKQINQIQTEKDVSSAINVFVVNGMTINNNYQGFNRINISSVEYFYK